MAITNVRGWWTGDIEGGTDKLRDEFTYHYQDAHYSKQKITELIPGRSFGVCWTLNSSSPKTQASGRALKSRSKSLQKGKQTEVRFADLG